MAQAVISDSKDAHAGDRMEYRLYVASAYPLFLIGAIIARLTSIGRKPPSSRQARRSVFVEAAAGVRSTIPWVFSGR